MHSVAHHFPIIFSEFVILFLDTVYFLVCRQIKLYPAGFQSWTILLWQGWPKLVNIITESAFASLLQNSIQGINHNPLNNHVVVGCLVYRVAVRVVGSESFPLPASVWLHWDQWSGIKDGCVMYISISLYYPSCHEIHTLLIVVGLSCTVAWVTSKNLLTVRGGDRDWYRR